MEASREHLAAVEAGLDAAASRKTEHDLRKKMRVIHDEVPPDYYDRSMAENPFQRFWHSRRVSAITSLLKGEDARMLDIGCGGGTLLDKISEKGSLKWSAGVDASLGAIKYANESHGGPKFLCADFYELPFEDSSFGFISAIEVLEHLHEPREALIELNRCLEDRGKLLVLVPNEQSLLFRVIWHFWTKGKGKVWKEAHVQKFTEESLEELLNSAGFTVTKKKKFLFGMLVAMKGKKVAEISPISKAFFTRKAKRA
ncbi:MAG: class I SAM-dependent methyltransferase [Deltaproteobacteria bacterium]|nr:class I SAM-dependent methyltransferase [Deltaproteobacteria bacterium]